MALPTSLSKDELRLLTSPRPELARMTIRPEILRRHCPLDNGLFPRHAKANSTNSCSNIGNLDAFPLEIIHLILGTLDLQSLTDFRVISWRARALVNSLQPYRKIAHYSPDALRALLSTQMAVHFTAKDIFNALCTQQCFGCGQFGPFLDLFTSHRQCITCVAYSDSLLSITASSAKTKFDLNPETLSSLPTLLSLPGRYTQSERACGRRLSLVRMVSVAATMPIQNDDFSDSLPPLDCHEQNPNRFMAIIRFPSLDIGTGKLDWGVSCQACRLGTRDKRRGYYNWNTIYSTAGYIEHFQKCQLSQIGRAVVPGYICVTEEDQRRSDVNFLGFLSKFRF